MITPDSTLKDASTAIQEGRFEEAFPLVSSVFGEIASGEPQAAPLYPVTMYLWKQLVGVYPPARETLAIVRAYHADLLLSGATEFCAGGNTARIPRFQLLVEIDQILNNRRGTHALFKQLMVASPHQASLEAYLALPAILEVGDYVLADRYLGDPLVRLEELNGMSVLYPLFPPAGKPPRLAAELANFIKDVLMRAAVLRGLGRPAEADAVLKKVRNGIVAREMRELAERELAAPGTIIEELAARQDRQHAQGAPG